MTEKIDCPECGLKQAEYDNLNFQVICPDCGAFELRKIKDCKDCEKWWQLGKLHPDCSKCIYELGRYDYFKQKDKDKMQYVGIFVG